MTTTAPCAPRVRARCLLLAAFAVPLCAHSALAQCCGTLGVNIASQLTHPMPPNFEPVWPQLTQQQKDAMHPHRGGAADGLCGGNGLNLLYPFDVNNTAGWTALPRGDDVSSGVINLGFTFQFYGTNYTSCFINNNGNITFGAAYAAYAPTGFPSATVPAMIAPFFADADTRLAASGRVYYKIIDSNNGGLPDTLIVTWDNVGYYNNNTDLLNTFQLVISNFTNPLMPAGSNVCFDYDNMCWTTGDINGTGGFTSPPSPTVGNATVGINRGNGSDYFQVGRFGVNSSSYDGPFGAADGVNYLDNKRFCFNTATGNVPPVPANMPANNTYSVAAGQVLNEQLQFLSPEFGQTTTINVIDKDGAVARGLVINPTSGNIGRLNLDWTTGCGDVGRYTLAVTARDNFSPQGVTTVNLTINVTEVNTVPAVGLTDPTPFEVICDNFQILGTATGTNFNSYVLEYSPNPGGPYTLIATGTNPVVNGVLGVFDTTPLARGNYFLRLRASNDCGPSASTSTVFAKCDAPLVATQPLPLTTLEGGLASFRVAQSGALCNATYQWQRNLVNVVNGPRISGATSDQLVIYPAQPADAGSYRCILSSPCGSSTPSNAANLLVTCYANCDGSAIPPVLNVADFTCFLQRFAAGCP